MLYCQSGLANGGELNMADRQQRKQRVEKELHEYAIASAYLFSCFTAILFYKSAVLGAAGFSAVPLGFAAAKALILGKFLLIGEAAGVGTRLESRNLLQYTLRKTVLLFLLLIALTVVEEMLVGWYHGRSVADTIEEHQWPSAMEIIANSLLMLLVLLPYVAVKELSRALGPGVLRRLWLSPSARPAAGKSQETKREDARS
jgi:hypothetical protein